MEKSERILLVLVIMVAAIFRIGAVLLINHTPVSDEVAYIAMAEGYLSGRGIVDSMGNLAFYNAGYPLMVLIPGGYILGDVVSAAKVANVALGIGSVYLCYLISREIGLGVFGRIASASMYAIYLPTAVYAVYVAKEGLMTFLMLAFSLYVIRSVRCLCFKNAVTIGVVTGALALVGNSGLVIVISLFWVLWVSDASIVKRWYFGIVVLLMSLLIVAPWLVRNMSSVGAPVLNTNGGFNFYLGNNPAADGYFVSIAQTPMGADWHGLRAEVGEYRASLILKEKAVGWIKENPLDFLQLLLKKAALFWWPPTHDGVGEGPLERLVRIGWLIQFVCVVSLFAVSMFVPWPKPATGFVLFLMVLSYVGVHAVFYVIYRYREPIMPLVVICAAVVLNYLWGIYKLRHLKDS